MHSFLVVLRFANHLRLRLARSPFKQNEAPIVASKLSKSIRERPERQMTCELRNPCVDEDDDGPSTLLGNPNFRKIKAVTPDLWWNSRVWKSLDVFRRSRIGWTLAKPSLTRCTMLAPVSRIRLTPALCSPNSLTTRLDVCMCELCTRIGLLLFYGNTSLLYSRSLS